MTFGKARVPLAFMLAMAASTSVDAGAGPPPQPERLELGSLKSLLAQPVPGQVAPDQPAASDDAAKGRDKTAQYWFNNPCFAGYWRRC